MIYDRAKVVPWTNSLTNAEMYAVALKFTKSRTWVFVHAENGLIDRITLFKTKKGAQDYLNKAVENLKKYGMWGVMPASPLPTNNGRAE